MPAECQGAVRDSKGPDGRMSLKEGMIMAVDHLLDADPLPLTLSVEQAGEFLGISRSAAYRAVSSGELPSVRIGRRLLIPTAKLLALLGLDDVRHGLEIAVSK
jgi:excisionase family DNA binding protein